MTTVAEIMDEPYTCRADATVGDVIRQLADVQFASVLIVDEEMRLVGFISDGDIMRFLAQSKPKVFAWGGEFMPVIPDDAPLEDRLSDLLDKPVMEIATRKKLYAEPDWELDEAAELFRREKVRKIAVVDKGRVVGVISESLIIRHILKLLLPEENK